MSAKRICIEKDRRTSDVGDKNSKVVINSLDYDSLAKIIMLLPIPERIDMEKVCTKWKEACQLAWYDIKKYKCKSSTGRCYNNCFLTQSYLEEILLRCGRYLKKLSLSDVCNSSIMPFVGNHCKNLTSLECEFDNKSLTDYADDFVRAFTLLDKLKCIKIITIDDDSYDGTVDLHTIIDSLPEEINQIHIISPETSRYRRPQKKISLNLKKFKNLQELILNACYFLEDIIFQEIAEKTTLIHLDIPLHVIPEKFCLFDKLVNLEYINLTPTMYFATSFELEDNSSPKVLNTIFCTCKNLQYLNMPTALHDIADIPHKKWIKLQNLIFLGISCNIMPDLANAIVEYCKNLKHLKINNPDGLMDETALKKLTELKNLESLILLPRIKLNTESIIAISNNCKKLSHLIIPGKLLEPSTESEPLSSPSVLDELSKLKNLEHLYLCGTLHLKESTIIAIANNCKNLSFLGIEKCTAVTETAFAAITNLKNLQKLDVTSLNITDDFIIKLKGLKLLECSHCRELTNAGIIQFIKNNPDLEKIDVSGINNITTDLIIAADQATKNRTNGIILHLTISDPSIRPLSTKPTIESQRLVVKYL